MTALAPKVDRLQARLVACVLPGSVWLGVLSSHVEWVLDVLTHTPEQLPPDERAPVARHLRLLMEATALGANPAEDGLVTQAREMTEATCALLGSPKPDLTDEAMLGRLVIPYEPLTTAITKLVHLAAQAIPAKGPDEDARRRAGDAAGHAQVLREGGALHRSSGPVERSDDQC